MNSDHGLGPGSSGMSGSGGNAFGSGGMVAAQQTTECSWAGSGNQSDSFYGGKKKKKKTKVCILISCACVYSGWCACAYGG